MHDLDGAAAENRVSARKCHDLSVASEAVQVSAQKAGVVEPGSACLGTALGLSIWWLLPLAEVDMQGRAWMRAP